MAINETKLSKYSPDCLVSINDFAVERKDRNEDGGGVAIYVRNTINYKLVENLPQHTLELMCLEIVPKRAKPFFVVCWYRPLSSTADKFHELENIISYLETFQKEIIFLGDTNCDLQADVSCSSVSKHMRDIYDAFGFELLIKEPTRVTLETKTLIDHRATTNTKNIVDSGVMRLGLSDHYSVYCVRKFMGNLQKTPKVFVTRQFKHFNKTAFLEDLRQVYWDDLLDTTDDPTVLVQLWTKVFVGTLDKHAPLMKRKGKNIYSPWVTQDLIHKRRTRDTLKAKAVKMKSEILMEAYRNLRNQVNRENDKLKRQYFAKKISDNEKDIKGTWNTINKLVDRRSKTTEIPYLEVKGEIISESKQKVEALNDYFATIGRDLNSMFQEDTGSEQTPPEGDIPSNPTHFRFRKISENAVLNANSRLKSKKSFGLDGISSYMLKIAGSLVSKGLANIFNISISTGTFPDSWKIAKVAPIFKEGSKSEIGN